MDLHDLLDAVDHHHVELELGPDRRIRARGPRAALAELGPTIRTNHVLLVAHLLGVVTGHVLAFCEGCNAPTITSVKTSSGSKRESWPACRMTPGCGGRNQHGTAAARHLPRPCDLAARAGCPPPPSRPTPPPKAVKARLLGPPAPWPTEGSTTA